MNKITYEIPDDFDAGCPITVYPPSPIDALTSLIELLEGGPLDNPVTNPEAYAAIFLAKVAASAWKPTFQSRSETIILSEDPEERRKQLSDAADSLAKMTCEAHGVEFPQPKGAST